MVDSLQLNNITDSIDDKDYISSKSQILATAHNHKLKKRHAPSLLLLSRSNSQFEKISSNESSPSYGLLKTPKKFLNITESSNKHKFNISDQTTASERQEGSISFGTSGILSTPKNQSFQVFTENFYENVERFLEEHNLYIIDPSCFHQPPRQSKKLMSLTKYQSVLLNNECRIGRPALQISLNKAPCDSITSGLRETGTQDKSIENISLMGSSLFRRRSERVLMVKTEKSTVCNQDTIITCCNFESNAIDRLKNQELDSAKSLPGLGKVNKDEIYSIVEEIELIGSNSYSNNAMNIIEIDNQHQDLLSKFDEEEEEKKKEKGYTDKSITNLMNKVMPSSKYYREHCL